MYKKLVNVISAALLMASFATSGMAESTSAKANATEQLTIEVDNLKLAMNVDVPPTGLSLGDIRYLNGTLRSENERGPIIGEGFLSNTVVRLMPEQHFMAMQYKVFTFTNKSDQIVAGGVAELPMTKNETSTQAIWGGSGKYFGVRGEVATTLKADGNYTDVFTILH